MPVRDRRECRGQIGERVDVVELAGFNERSDAGPGAAALVMTTEQMVLPAQSDRPDAVLNGIVVDLYPAIGEEDPQTIPVVGDVAELFPKPGLGRDPRALLLEPSPER